MVILFVDMKAAFDSVDRGKLIEAIRKRRVREGIVRRWRWKRFLRRGMGKSEIRGKKDVYIADDIAVLAKDEEGMKGMMGKLERYLHKIGMELKTGKTKIMKCRKGGSK